MAIREIRTEGDPILRKQAKPVREMTDRIRILVGDLFDTMYEAGGVGIAAPQVGILKKVFVIDCGEESREPLTFINPEIVELNGEQTGFEGCLSVPGFQGTVTRAESLRIRYLDQDMVERELCAEGLLARCIQHENDHLYGILYVDKVEGELREVTGSEEGTD